MAKYPHEKHCAAHFIPAYGGAYLGGLCNLAIMAIKGVNGDSIPIAQDLAYLYQHVPECL